MTEGREVRHSETFVAHAKEEFPVGGSAEGHPSWEMFVAGPLKAIEAAFGRSWEKNAVAAAGVRVVMTHALPYFPAMAVYAALVVDEGVEYVELLDIVVDRDYFDLIEDDPT